MYDTYSVWLLIILAGIIGCVATGLAVQVATGIPMKAVAAHPGKLLWSVIFALPLPFLLSLQPTLIGLFTAYLCLSVLPSLASKFHFGPKNVTYFKLMIFNSIFAIVAILAFLTFKQLL